MTKEIFLRLGLTARDYAIYTTLLNSGPLGVAELARRARLFRPVVYQALPRLIEKQLIAKVPFGKRVLFAAESPDNLLALLRTLENEVRQELPALKEQYERLNERPTVRSFEGAQGIRSVYQDLLASVKKGDVVYRYESPTDYKKLKKYVPTEYSERLVHKSEVDWYIITNEDTFKRKTRYLGRLFKMVPASYDLFSYDVSEFIYHDKVAFIDFKHEVAMIIESPSLAAFQKKIFKLLFGKL